LPGWLRTTIRRECLMLLRHKKRQIPSGSIRIEGAVEPDMEARLIGEERRAAARDAVARLPDRDRERLSMLFATARRRSRRCSPSVAVRRVIGHRITIRPRRR
jgi:DNA-directed RNA polymerase specialized sigma24 family protein